MLIAQSLTWTSPEWWWAIAQVCIGLGLVIFVHELGHFLVAKACGVKCEKFYVGFDFFDIKIGDTVLIPRSLVKFQWGETEYGVGIVPLGGYVKMLGQDDNPGNMEQEIQRSKVGDEKDGTESLGVLDRDQIDPRSYLAKSVPQRMAIISAGVIFNLIFAVIFAAIAFRSGVDYNPPIIGDVTPGGPGWESNLFGSEVRQVGDSVVADYYPFMDLAQEVALSGEGKPIELKVSKDGSESVESISVIPREGLRDDIDLALIGIGPATIPQVTSDDELFVDGHIAEKAEPPFEKNDHIVEIAGEPIENIFDLKRIVVANFDKEIDFVVERGEQNERVTIKVGKNPMNSTGLVMKWGPIKSIQNASPAAEAGVEVGDEILAIDGKEPGDLFSLEQRMTKLARDFDSGPGEGDSKHNAKIKLKLKRGEKEIDLEITPRVPVYFARLENNQPVAINSLGIAVDSTRFVHSSEVDGINPGDEITDFEFILPDDESKEIFKKRAKNPDINLVDSNTSWTTIANLVRTFPAGFKFNVSAKTAKGGEATGNGQTVASSEYFIATRGVWLQMMQNTYRSPNWSDAFKFGVKQTIKDASRVFKFLGKLVRGKISPKNLGGPGMIAAAATSEATQGTSRLLLFLVLLSANLAIVNFLPIPVLDGGHMLFLAYEGLFRQPPNEKIQIILTYAGLFMILGLMLYVIFLDIQRFSGWF